MDDAERPSSGFSQSFLLIISYAKYAKWILGRTWTSMRTLFQRFFFCVCHVKNYYERFPDFEGKKEIHAVRYITSGFSVSTQLSATVSGIVSSSSSFLSPKIIRYENAARKAPPNGPNQYIQWFAHWLFQIAGPNDLAGFILHPV